MREVNKMMRNKAMVSRLISGILCIVIGVAACIVMCERPFKWYTADKDVFATDHTMLMEDEFYTCNNNLLLDWYGSDEEGYYYITPAYNEYTDAAVYMGFYVYSEDKASADKIMEATQSYWFGETENAPSTYIAGRGYIYNMSEKEKGYFKDWFTSAGADKATLDNLCYKTFVLTSLEKTFDASTVAVIIIFAIVILIGLFTILGLVFGTYKKKVKKTMKKNGVLESDLENDLANATRIKNLVIGRKYTMVLSGTPELAIHANLVWVYVFVRRTRHMLYGIIPTGTTTATFVHLVDRNNDKLEIEVKNEALGQEVVQAICKAVPHVIMGYHDDLQTLANADFAQIVAMVDEKKAELSFERPVQEVAASSEEEVAVSEAEDAPSDMEATDDGGIYN